MTFHQIVSTGLVAVFLGLGGWGLLSINSLQAKAAATDVQVQNTQVSIDGMNHRLERIENKVDRILERQLIRISDDSTKPDRKQTP